MPINGRLQLGQTYRTLGAGPVTIDEESNLGRKPFGGKLRDGMKIRYFRNGRFSNASQRKGGHKFDIIATSRAKPTVASPS
jgi:hypothetical protein